MTAIPMSYGVPGELTSPKFAQAFARGCGGSYVQDMRIHPGDVAGFWTPKLWPVLQQAQREGRTYYYGDHGYFGRGRYYRITKNRIQHDGLGESSESSGTRFRLFKKPVRTWRNRGAHVLICPQSDTYFRLFGLTLNDWVGGVIGALSVATDRKLVVRNKSASTSIEEDLKNCWATVTFSSSAALDALIAGVPVFVLADFAAAYRMGRSDLSLIENPLYPAGRQSFLAVLADNQWTLDEIRRGEAWKALSHVH